MDSSSDSLVHPSPHAGLPLSWLPCSPLGSGSFGHVSLAINLHDRCLFAVKSAISASSHALLASLQNEFHILHSLQSPFIIRCLGAESFHSSTPSAAPCTDGHGSPQPSVRNLFLEYMEGGSLADALKQSGGRFCEESHIRRFTQSILQGLAYLHANGIVHCDIKSQNILIGSSGVKIADFGMARRLDEASSASSPMMPGNLRGTPLWMAPEVALGGEAMPASDIWSLGCTVVEMLQGRPPWGHVVSSSEAALFKVGCSTQTPPLPEFISAETRDFLLKCLQRDPQARWTAGDLLKHPFVCSMELQLAEDERAFCISGKGNLKAQLPSPRSTLEFFLNSDCESDWETELESPRSLDCVPAFPPCCTERKAVASHHDDAISLMEAGRRSDWIVVKQHLSPSAYSCNKPSEMPFMLQPAEIKRASEVSFASADFLLRKCNRSSPSASTTIVVG